MSALHASLWGWLRCPSCRGGLSRTRDTLRCEHCAATFPIVRGVPVLIDEAKSLFQVADCVASGPVVRRPRTWRRAISEAAARLLPEHAHNIEGTANMKHLADLLRAEAKAAKILVLGGASLGVGMEVLLAEPSFVLAETDIVLGSRTNLIADANDVPFADGTFDAVVTQGMLGHMADPFHIADEIHRVLRRGGYVYAEAPFMQQVCGGPYDFFRFTHVGHRRIFHRFEEVKSGIAGGPGMALSWAYRYFLRTFADGVTGRALASAAADLTSCWLMRVDERLAHRPGAFDAASGFYFLGRSLDAIVSDREIVAGYRGAWKMHA